MASCQTIVTLTTTVAPTSVPVTITTSVALPLSAVSVTYPGFNFRTGPIQVASSSVKWSTYRCDGLFDVLGRIDPTHWVLCVWYDNYNDIQVCFTGSVPNGKFPREACELETREEVRLAPRSLSCYELMHRTTSFVERRKTYRETSIFSINAADCAFSGYKAAGPKDDSDDKVGIILHGTFDEMMQLLDTYCADSTSPLTDKIKAVVAVPVADAIRAAAPRTQCTRATVSEQQRSRKRTHDQTR